MHVSFNEIASTGKRAARGAGYSWGLAEETGQAARWMAERQMPFAALLLGQLARVDGAGGGRCPLTAGTALADTASGLRGGQVITLHQVSCPALLLPFAASAAEASGRAILLTWDGYQPASPFADSRFPTALAEEVKLHMLAHAAPASPPVPGLKGAEVDPHIWRQLAALAARTYVPASEHSRRAGAGSGSTDGD